MRLDKIILSLGIGLASLAGCCNTDKIKEDALRDFFLIGASINKEYKEEYASHKEETDEFIKDYIKNSQLVKEYYSKYPQKFIFNQEELKETPFELVYKKFSENNSKYKEGLFCNERKIREEIVREYIGFGIYLMKLSKQLDKLPESITILGPMPNSLIYMFSTDYHNYVDEYGPISYNDFLKLKNNK